MVRKTLVLATIIAAGFPFSALSSNGWKVERQVDSMTDKELAFAVIDNDTGELLKVWQREDGAIWATFRLSDGNGDVFAARLPLMRVDKSEPIDLDTLRTVQELLDRTGRSSDRLYEQEPKWLHVSILASDAKPAPPNLVFQLMHGQQLVVRYFLFTGGFKESKFTLQGAKTAIGAACNVPPPPTAAEIAEQAQVASQIEENQRADEAASVRCIKMNGAKYLDCTRARAACRDKFSPDSKEFGDCMIAVGN